MRLSPALLAAIFMAVGLTGATLGVPAAAQALSPASVAMQQEGERLLAANDLDGATGYFETALAADPRNAAAYIGLGHIAVAQELPGKAIGFFRMALRLDPTNRVALGAQGAALVQRGALDKARTNLARLRGLCGGDSCPEVAALTAALASAGQRTALRPEEVLPQPVVEPAPATVN